VHAPVLVNFVAPARLVLVIIVTEQSLYSGSERAIICRFYARGKERGKGETSDKGPLFILKLIIPEIPVRFAKCTKRPNRAAFFFLLSGRGIRVKLQERERKRERERERERERDLSYACMMSRFTHPMKS